MTGKSAASGSVPLAGRMSVVQGDITQQQVDVIVNAANESLLGGGGVDGAIHWAAGPELLAECSTIGGCPTGEARITRGYRLPARHVVHTVGPRWQGGNRGEAELLAACYRNSLRLAVAHAARTIAFPGISTGLYGYPLEEATRVALSTVRACLAEMPSIDEVRFVTYSESATRTAQHVLAELSRKEASAR